MYQQLAHTSRLFWKIEPEQERWLSVLQSNLNNAKVHQVLKNMQHNLVQLLEGTTVVHLEETEKHHAECSRFSVCASILYRGENENRTQCLHEDQEQRQQ
jgi:hypothetical protein